MKKRLLLFITSAFILSTLLTGCTDGSDEEKNDTAHNTDLTTNGSVTSSPDSESQPNETAPDPEESGESTEAEQGSPSEEITAAAVANVIKNAYGDSYLPDTQMDSDRVNELLGISAEDCADIYAESPMIGTHPDTLIIIKPAEGKLDEIKSKLEAYREKLINDSLQYPMNIAKVNAAQVVTGGDYAAFILLGAINENEDASEEEQAQFAEAQEKIGVDAFNSCFEAIEPRKI